MSAAHSHRRPVRGSHVRVSRILRRGQRRCSCDRWRAKSKGHASQRRMHSHGSAGVVSCCCCRCHSRCLRCCSFFCLPLTLLLKASLGNRQEECAVKAILLAVYADLASVPVVRIAKRRTTLNDIAPDFLTPTAITSASGLDAFAASGVNAFPSAPGSSASRGFCAAPLAVTTSHCARTIVPFSNSIARRPIMHLLAIRIASCRGVTRRCFPLALAGPIRDGSTVPSA